MAKITPMRVVFMGSPAFALPTLQALMDARHEIVGVYCQSPKPAGRGQKLTPCPVQAFADEHDFPVFSPAKLRGAETEHIALLEPDIIVVVAYGLILPKAILDIPPYGCINLHPSLLPRWRGPSPIQRPIIAGDTETAATIMRMDEGCDTGPVLLYKKVPIPADTNTAQMQDTLAVLGAELMVAALAGLQLGVIKPQPQSAEGVTYAPKLDKEEGKLDWKRPAVELERLIRGLNPWPMAYFDYNGERIKVFKATVVPSEYRIPPGEVVQDQQVTQGALCVGTRDGLLRLDELQRPGRKPMLTEEFLKGFSIPEGSTLG